MWWHREYSYSATRSGWEDGSPGIVRGHPSGSGVPGYTLSNRENYRDHPWNDRVTSYCEVDKDYSKVALDVDDLMIGFLCL